VGTTVVADFEGVGRISLMKSKQKGFAVLVLALIFMAATAVAGGVYWWQKSIISDEEQTAQTVSGAQEEQETTERSQQVTSVKTNAVSPLDDITGGGDQINPTISTSTPITSNDNPGVIFKYLKLETTTKTNLGTDSKSPTEDPAIVSGYFTTTSPVDTMKFHYEFTPLGEGYLSIWIDDRLVRSMDQRYVTNSGIQDHLFIGEGPGEPLSIGKHKYAVRLDGYGGKKSSVILTDVTVGTTVLVSP